MGGSCNSQGFWICRLTSSRAASSVAAWVAILVSGTWAVQLSAESVKVTDKAGASPHIFESGMACNASENDRNSLCVPLSQYPMAQSNCISVMDGKNFGLQMQINAAISEIVHHADKPGVVLEGGGLQPNLGEGGHDALRTCAASGSISSASCALTPPIRINCGLKMCTSPASPQVISLIQRFSTASVKGYRRQPQNRTPSKRVQPGPSGRCGLALPSRRSAHSSRWLRRRRPRRPARAAGNAPARQPRLRTLLQQMSAGQMPPRHRCQSHTDDIGAAPGPHRPRLPPSSMQFASLA